jgi:hypothetical protein
MLLGVVLLAGAVAAQPPAARPASREIFRLELAGSQTLWSQDRPMQSGGLVLFHRYPDGVLLSIKRSDLLRVVASRYQSGTTPALRPGGLIELGVTGGASAESGEGTAANAAPKPPALGERKDGKALLNPDRPYKPEWDSKQVPGLNIGLPAARNDYREGKTFAYPPASAVQSAPGDLPRARVETGDPKSPN